MTTRPSSPPPEWASGASALIDEPSEAKKDEGYIAHDTPTAAGTNWQLNLTWQWLVYLSETAGSHATLEDLVDALDPDGFGLVEEHGDGFGEQVDTVAAGSSIISVDTTGKAVVFTSGPDIYVVERGDLGTTIRTMSPASVSSGSLQTVISDGQYVVVVLGDEVECFDYEDGSSQWLYDHGAFINDIAMDDDRVYLVGEAGTGTHHARALDLATGSVVWSYDHGGDLEGVATDGRRLYVAGAASSHSSGATVRALVASSGADAAGEGGTSTDSTRLAWDKATTNPIDEIATDGRVLIGAEGGFSPDVLSLGCGDGTQLASVSLSSSVADLSIDQDYVLVSGSSGNWLKVYDPRDLGMAWMVDYSGSTVRSAVSDGGAVFVAVGTDLHRLTRGNRSATWRRVDPSSEPYLLLRQLAIPA